MPISKIRNNLVSFADVVHPSVTFSRDVPAQALALELFDTPWLQRLRDISQTANTRLVYMFSEHSRFGHSVGVAYLANLLLQKLAAQEPHEIERYACAVSAAAVLHDIGHLAPGSHVSYKTWFPHEKDSHEETAIRIVQSDERLQSILNKYGRDLAQTVCLILEESDKVPPWSWEIISGGGWNVDRGNWSVVDSVLAGVSYGKYNIPALTESIVITPDKHLALLENRLDAMMHFALSRQAMYRQVYQHRVLRAADMLNRAIVQRARDLNEHLEFADECMRAVLGERAPQNLSLQTIFRMRESWWLYHLSHWSRSSDTILTDLSRRLLERDLFKTVRLLDSERKQELWDTAVAKVKEAGYDPRYYLHEASTSDAQESEQKRSMLVFMDDGSVRTLPEAEPLFQALLKESAGGRKTWLVMPATAKELLGRRR